MPLIVVVPLRADMLNLAGPSVPANSLQVRLTNEGQTRVQANAVSDGFIVAVTTGNGEAISGATVAIRLPEDGATGAFQDGNHSAVVYTDASGIAKFPKVTWGPTPGPVSIRVTAVKNDLSAGALISGSISANGLAAAKAGPILKPNISVVNTPGEQLNSIPPGTVKPAEVHSGANPNGTTQTSGSSQPAVSVVTTGSKAGSSGSKKWIILAAIAAGAGVGMALALGGKGATTIAAATPGVTIGSPTISVGH